MKAEAPFAACWMSRHMTRKALQNHCMCLSMAGYTLINIVCEVDVFLSEVSTHEKSTTSRSFRSHKVHCPWRYFQDTFVYLVWYTCYVRGILVLFYNKAYIATLYAAS